MGNLGSDVVLDDSGQSSLVLDVGNPSRELRVPQGSMASDELAIGGGEVCHGVSAAEGESVTRRLDSVPLHGVLGSQLAKVSLDDCNLLGIVDEVWVDDVTPVLLAFGNEGCVERLDLAGVEGVWCWDSQHQWQEERCSEEVHDEGVLLGGSLGSEE